MESFPIFKVPVTFEEHLTHEGHHVPAWADYIISTYGGLYRGRTLEINYQELKCHQSLATNMMSSPGSRPPIEGLANTCSGIGWGHSIPVHTELDPSLTVPVPAEHATRWINKSLRVGELKYGRAIQCIGLFKLKSDPNKFRFLIDTGSCTSWLSSDYQTEESRLPGSRGPPYLPTRIYPAKPGKYMHGRPKSDQEVHTVTYLDDSWYQYKLRDDYMTFECEFQNQRLTRDVVFEFGVLVDSHFGKNSGRLPPEVTFHDGMLGFGPTDERNKMMTLMDSVIGEDIIRFPSLTFSMDRVTSTQNKFEYHGTMIFGHPPDYYRDMHGPIAIETVEGHKPRWTIKSGGKKIGKDVYLEDTLILLDTGAIGIHLRNAKFVDAFHQRIQGATKEYGAWAFPVTSVPDILWIQFGTGDSSYIEVLPEYLKGEPIRGTNLCWSRLCAWHTSVNHPTRSDFDIIGMAAIISLTLMYQFDTLAMTKYFEREKYVDGKGQEIDTHGNHIYWRQSWTRAGAIH